MNPVVWFEIYVADLARARAFYEQLLDMTLEPMEQVEGDWPEMWLFPGDEQGRGACGALVKMEGVGPGPGGTLVYLHCNDCAVPAGRATGLGGSLVRDKFAIGPYGFIALITDSEGNMIGLHSQR
ncbi:VOC family protein [Oceanimonas pelagia]|uniref:VOC family protein n=1 Tax=Oceanimonas pelagia TaxID=3028314 RepID=A0AA50KND9_9GAMM|nr:VOC family protein [Oceanimonas pelagia]WMC10708.1 VOC family protein [Oceanimonas pelagia]